MRKTEQIQEQINESIELLDSFETYINQNFKLTINDEQTTKSLREIREYFEIKIPTDLNFMTVIALAREVAVKYQRATFLRDKQGVKLNLLAQTRQTKYNQAYQAAREEAKQTGGKPLAAESCKVEALIAVKDLDNSSNTQQVIFNYWDSICKTLVEVRKLIETISIALSGDAKIQRDFIVKEGK